MINVREILGGPSAPKMHGMVCPYCNHVLFYYLIEPIAGRSMNPQYIYYPNGEKHVSGSPLRCVNCEKVPTGLRLTMQLLDVTPELLNKMGKKDDKS